MAIASNILLLPLPFGPIITVNFLSNEIFLEDFIDEVYTLKEALLKLK